MLLQRTHVFDTKFHYSLHLWTKKIRTYYSFIQRIGHRFFDRFYEIEYVMASIKVSINNVDLLKILDTLIVEFRDNLTALESFQDTFLILKGGKCGYHYDSIWIWRSLKQLGFKFHSWTIKLIVAIVSIFTNILINTLGFKWILYINTY